MTNPLIAYTTGERCVLTTLNTLVGRTRITDVAEPCLVTYALGCKGYPYYVAEMQLYDAMLVTLINAWRKAHRLKLFGYYFFPPRVVVWRRSPDFSPDPDVVGGYKLTLRVGFL